MRPAPKGTDGAGVRMIREQADLNFRSRSVEHSEHGPSLLPLRRSKSDSQLLFYPFNGKGTST